MPLKKSQRDSVMETSVVFVRLLTFPSNTAISEPSSTCVLTDWAEISERAKDADRLCLGLCAVAGDSPSFVGLWGLKANE